MGASGGVGISAIEIAKAMGAKVVAAASSDEKLEVCKEYGADEVINYGKYDLSNLEYLITLNVDDEHPVTPKSITSAQIHDLRNIYDIYLLAHNHYQNSLPTFKPSEPTEHNMAQINDAIDTDVPLTHDVLYRMLTNIHDNPTERDDHIWEFMKTHLNDSNKTEKGTDNLKYIRYVRSMSKGKGDLKSIIGITLNDDGIAIFNKESFT